jgi:hypothetical protein
MEFQVVKQKLVEVLGAGSNGLFKVIGYQKQGYAGESLKGVNNTVQVFYDAGNFPQTSAPYSLEIKHNLTFRLELMVAAPSTGDIDILNNPDSTDQERAGAITGIQNAAGVADEKLDNLFARVYQILMKAQNIDLSLPKYSISSRWIPSFRKDKPSERGDLVILTGLIEYICSVKENVEGLTPLDLESNELENSELGAESGIKIDY